MFGQIKVRNICTKGKILRNQMVKENSGLFRAITQHSLGDVPISAEGLEPRFCSVCLTWTSWRPEKLPSQVPLLSISPAPGRSQPYTHSWQFLETITETRLSLGSPPSAGGSKSSRRASLQSRGRLQEFTPAPCAARAT